MNQPVYMSFIENEFENRTGKLELINFGLTEIPAEISNMTWLEELDLNGNQITAIASLDGLINLKKLNLSNNRIAKIENLTGLQKLEELRIFNNMISTLEGLDSLHKLTFLNAGTNRITRIEGLEQLENLGFLALYENNLTRIEGLENLKKIYALFLSENQVTRIEGIDNLSVLLLLHLQQNRITKIENLENCPLLNDINLGKNQIRVIEGLAHLGNLTKLDLEANPVSDISALATHTRLRYLGLSRTKVKDITAIKHLDLLEDVYLSQCKLDSFEPLRDKPNIKRLILSNTGIRDLRPLLPLIERKVPVKWVYGFEYNGDGIFVKDNPQLDIPMEITEQGDEAILKFYALQQTTHHSAALDEITLYEAKLIIVGEGKVGKSSLRVKLIDKDAVLPREDERTRGIDIVDYTFPIPGNKEFIAHIWDFGGQNIQFALHRFFMTENSLYILMTESRQERDKNFDYWFQNIELFGGKESPIIVTMNLTNGERGANIDIASYISIFKNIRYAQVQEVNLLNPSQDNGLQKLTEIIQKELESLPHIQKPIFRCWLDLRAALQEEAKTLNYISIERFYALCEQHEVDEEYIELVGRYLHNLGIVLWYHDKEFLKNKMILNPLWAINAIYRIIDDKTIQNRKGIFDQNDKDRLWNDASYRFAKDELTSLLKVFKICFQRQNVSEYIIPALMEAVPPEEAAQWDKTNNKKVMFTFPFMPKGLVNQLTADMHKHITDELLHVWAYGILLHYADDRTTTALIKENSYTRQIEILVKGNYAARFIGIIIQALKNIIDTYKGLRYSMEIACVCEKCIQTDKPQIYTEADLMEKIREGKTKVYCNKLDEKIDIQPILESIGIHHAIFEKHKRAVPESIAGEKEQNKKLKVFLSYSHAQTEYFKIFRDDLKTYLRLPDRDIEIFQDVEIPIGAKWDEFLADKVDQCDVMILLVSQEFMNSTYIKEKEFGAALKKDGLLIAPVYFAPCAYKEEKELYALQFFKPDGSNYEQAERGTRFSYINLVKFRESDGMPIPNSNRSNYMMDFTEKLKKEIQRLGKS